MPRTIAARLWRSFIWKRRAKVGRCQGLARLIVRPRGRSGSPGSNGGAIVCCSNSPCLTKQGYSSTLMHRSHRLRPVRPGAAGRGLGSGPGEPPGHFPAFRFLGEAMGEARGGGAAGRGPGAGGRGTGPGGQGPGAGARRYGWRPEIVQRPRPAGTSLRAGARGRGAGTRGPGPGAQLLGAG